MLNEGVHIEKIDGVILFRPTASPIIYKQQIGRALSASKDIEKCVICGADTPYRFSTPISQREFYVEGSGQICIHCHYEIYIKKNR